jgi:hypothetical protein
MYLCMMLGGRYGRRIKNDFLRTLIAGAGFMLLTFALGHSIPHPRLDFFFVITLSLSMGLIFLGLCGPPPDRA